MKRRQSLQSFVYRGLAKRIVLAALVITAAVSTAAVILKERGVASEAVVETAHNRIQILLARARPTLIRPSGNPWIRLTTFISSCGWENLSSPGSPGPKERSLPGP